MYFNRNDEMIEEEQLIDFSKSPNEAKLISKSNKRVKGSGKRTSHKQLTKTIDLDQNQLSKIQIEIPRPITLKQINMFELKTDLAENERKNSDHHSSSKDKETEVFLNFMKAYKSTHDKQVNKAKVNSQNGDYKLKKRSATSQE